MRVASGLGGYEAALSIPHAPTGPSCGPGPALRWNLGGVGLPDPVSPPTACLCPGTVRADPMVRRAPREPAPRNHSFRGQTRIVVGRRGMERQNMPDFAYRTEATIDAPPEMLFNIVSDLSLHVELAGSGELKAVTQNPAGDVETGTRFLAEESVKLADGSGMDVTADSVVVTVTRPPRCRGSSTPSCLTGSAGCSGGSTSRRKATEHASCMRSRSTSATCRTRCSRDFETTSSKSALPLSESAWTAPSRTSAG